MESIEKKAVRVVIEYEKKKGRSPVDVSKQGKGYDIESEDMCIEVKGQSAKPDGRPKQNWLIFDNSCCKTMYKERDYYIYLVFNLSKDKPLEEDNPKLIIFNRDEILRSLRSGVSHVVWSNTKRLKELEVSL